MMKKNTVSQLVSCTMQSLHCLWSLSFVLSFIHSFFVFFMFALLLFLSFFLSLTESYNRVSFQSALHISHIQPFTHTDKNHFVFLYMNLHLKTKSKRDWHLQPTHTSPHEGNNNEQMNQVHTFLFHTKKSHIMILLLTVFMCVFQICCECIFYSSLFFLMISSTLDVLCASE